jgi:hypothetical protein
MKQIELAGKSEDEIRQLLAKTPRQALLQLITRLVALEPHFTVTEFAQARRMTRDKVLKLIDARQLTPVHVPTERGDYRIPLSAVRDFDRRTAIGTR